MGKKTTKKETKKVCRELAVSEPKRSLVWGGALPSVAVKEEDKEKLRVFCNQVAKIYGVPSLGVNAMGGQPYLNKDGRLFLLHELRSKKEAPLKIKKEFIQLSTGLDVPAIMKTTLVFRDGHEVEAIGEASKQNVKLEAVKATLNMMAETRSLNRAIWQEIAGDVWNRVAENLERARGLSPDDKERVIKAGAVSFEEMQQPQKKNEQKETTPEQLREIIIGAIKTSKKKDEIIDIDEQTQKSDKLSKAVKKEIHVLASARVDELEVKKNAKN